MYATNVGLSLVSRNRRIRLTNAVSSGVGSLEDGWSSDVTTTVDSVSVEAVDTSEAVGTLIRT